ncbi:MAG: diadenylate cyclase CdaA, partial [Deltaproteobacteria bacterium]|nr:diadenylate cyclase CdaA [Deltaproteobacteria bacterium]
IADLRFQDVLDILFLSVVAYHLYLWFRGTKAFKALVGLLVLGVIFTVARTWGLFLTTWVFQILWQVLVILLIILFQSEIRQALERVNPLQALGLRKHAQPGKWIQVLAETAFAMAKKRIGALLIIERTDRVDEWITAAQSIEGSLSPEFLMSIFQKQSPLHDGATVLRDGRITLVASYLPLSSNESLPTEWGTRHRAAAGLSERCDALVVVVSEERGEVTVVSGGQGVVARSPEEISRYIQDSVKPLAPPRTTPWDRIQSLILYQGKAKAGSLFLVIVLWLMLAGQQDFEVTLTLPLEGRNLPARITLLEPQNPKVRVKVRGLRKDASTLSAKNVQVGVDLSTAAPGRKAFPITREQIRLPSDRVYVVNIDPTQITFSFERKP